ITKPSDDYLSVINCSDPDMNVGFVSHMINGNTSTNDDPIHPLWYSDPIMLQKPVSATQQLIVQADGTYQFSGNRPGKYKYTIKACSSVQPQNCTAVPLEITLVDLYQTYSYVSNPEFITVLEQSISGVDSAEIFIASNEDCFSY